MRIGIFFGFLVAAALLTTGKKTWAEPAKPPVDDKSLKQQVDNLQSQLNKLNLAVLAKLPATVQEQSAQIGSLQTQLKQRGLEIDALQTQLRDRGKEIEELKGQMARLAQQVQRSQEGASELQGRWKVVEVTEQGKARESAVAALVFEGRSVILKYRSGRDDKKMSYRVDCAGKANAIDLDGGPLFLSGIFKIQGNSLRLCFTPAPSDRPSDFTSTPDSATTLWVLQRE